MFSYQYAIAEFTNATHIIAGDLQETIANINLASATIQYINTEGIDSNQIVTIFFSNELYTTSELDQQEVKIVDDKDRLDALIAIFTNKPTGTICSIKDIKTTGTNGGTFIKDIWTTRDLNNIDGNISFLTLSNNIITIEPGSYIIDIKAPACSVNNNQIRLRNITESTYALGSNAYAFIGQMTLSTLHDLFIFDATIDFDIQHICSDSADFIGFGRASGQQTSEVYTNVFIQKIE